VVPTPQISPNEGPREVGSTPQIRAVGRAEATRLDSGEVVFIVKPGHPLHLALAANAANVHLLLWRVATLPTTRIVIHADGHLLMSAVVVGSGGGVHVSGGAAVSAVDDLFVDAPPGTRQLVLDSDGELAVAWGN
jgi:hypothetical protein